MENQLPLKFINHPDKDMANGMRNTTGTLLTDEEIDFIKSEIKRIGADESVFVFNDPDHQKGSTCYNYEEDIIYVTRNVFPDTKYASIHPRDVMSVAAVLSHEYYGHRPNRDEYMSDKQKGLGYHTTPIWQDECRASINAARYAKNLTDREKCDLVMDAVYRANENGQYIEMDGFMKGVLYGYNDDSEKNIAPIKYVSKESVERKLGV